jgi:putative sigma-54 modulation protein
MIQKMEINGIHFEVDEDIKKYVTKKIGKLDKYMPRAARESAHAEVKLKNVSKGKKNQYTCEVILHLPHDVITTQETTINVFAAVDIVETKLKNQLKKYKDTHSVLRGRTRRLISKIRSHS